MLLTTWLDGLPLSVLFAMTLLGALLSIFVGIRLGSLGKAPISADSIGPATGATLGLLAFMLAFTFNMTASRFDGRKQLIIDETNAIGSAYSRSGLLPPMQAQELRALIQRYADVRSQLAHGELSIEDAITRSESIQDEMWLKTEQIVRDLPASVYYALFVQSINEIIDLQTSRIILGLQFRIPGVIWAGLYAIAALAMMLVGYQLGASSRRRVVVSCTLATAFSAVIFMIADLDRASEGFTSLNQQAYVDLAERLARDDQ